MNTSLNAPHLDLLTERETAMQQHKRRKPLAKAWSNDKKTYTRARRSISNCNKGEFNMKTKNQIIALVSIVALSIFSTLAIAEPASEKAGQQSSDSTPTHPSNNKLKDQSMSKKDINASQSGPDTKAIQMGFKRLDADDNGTISKEEAAKHATLITKFRSFDKNSDQKLNMEEYAQFAEANSTSLLNNNNSGMNKSQEKANNKAEKLKDSANQDPANKAHNPKVPAGDPRVPTVDSQPR